MAERERTPLRRTAIGVYFGSGNGDTMKPPKKVGSGARRAKTATNGASSGSKPRD